MPKPASTTRLTIITCKSVWATPRRDNQHTRYHTPTLPPENQCLGDSVLLGGGGVRKSPSMVTGICFHRFLALWEMESSFWVPSSHTQVLPLTLPSSLLYRAPGEKKEEDEGGQDLEWWFYVTERKKMLNA